LEYWNCGMMEYWNVEEKEDRNNGRMVIGERSHKIKLGVMTNR
jgi:hypothetical protein